LLNREGLPIRAAFFIFSFLQSARMAKL
jgi:hypothetical protein